MQGNEYWLNVSRRFTGFQRYNYMAAVTAATAPYEPDSLPAFFLFGLNILKTSSKLFQIMC